MINNDNPKQEDLRPYRKLGLTVLQLMGLLGTLGIVLTVMAHHYF